MITSQADRNHLPRLPVNEPQQEEAQLMIVHRTYAACGWAKQLTPKPMSWLMVEGLAECASEQRDLLVDFWSVPDPAYPYKLELLGNPGE